MAEPIAFRSPSVRRWVASLSIVGAVIEDVFGVIVQITGTKIALPQPVVIASIALFACGSVAFLSWIWRAHRNLWDLGVGGIQVSPGWAVGWWFIPLGNLFKPYVSMRELWWASDASDEPSRGILGAGSALPLIWWLSFIMYNVTIEGFVEVPWVMTVRGVSAAAGVVSAACILVMMPLVDARQREMANPPDVVPSSEGPAAPLVR